MYWYKYIDLQINLFKIQTYWLEILLINLLIDVTLAFNLFPQMQCENISKTQVLV